MEMEGTIVSRKVRMETIPITIIILLIMTIIMATQVMEIIINQTSQEMIIKIMERIITLIMAMIRVKITMKIVIQRKVIRITPDMEKIKDSYRVIPKMKQITHLLIQVTILQVITLLYHPRMIVLQQMRLKYSLMN